MLSVGKETGCEENMKRRKCTPAYVSHALSSASFRRDLQGTEHERHQQAELELSVGKVNVLKQINHNVVKLK